MTIIEILEKLVQEAKADNQEIKSFNLDRTATRQLIREIENDPTMTKTISLPPPDKKLTLTEFPSFSYKSIPINIVDIGEKEIPGIEVVYG